MTDKKWSYGGFAEKYNMDGEIKIGTGVVKVHDIFEPLPEFMKKADCIFVDPPCSNGNLKSFYTKNAQEMTSNYDKFFERLWECIEIINPKLVFIEVFESNAIAMFEKLNETFIDSSIIDTTYYFNKNKLCKIIVGSKQPFSPKLRHFIDSIAGLDEQEVIEAICKNTDFNCIGDLCMGRGLVGFYANKYNKPFVGLELNKNRLAVLLERINKGKLKV